MTLTEKIAYLKGLADGLDLDKESTKESRILSVIIEVLEEMGYAIEDLEEADAEIIEGLDAVSEDLEDVEEILFDEIEDGCGCDDCHCGDDEEDFFEIECPNCDEELMIDAAVLEAGEITCPNCGDVFALDLVEDDEDEDEDKED